MDKVKTFPLHLTERFLEQIGESAKKTAQSKQDFIIEAVKEKMEKVQN